jgi:hypothetical protein
MPLLIALIIGISEFGLAFKDWLSVSNASREGARMGAVVGNDIDADCFILGAITEAFAAAADPGQIQELWIFKANSDGSPSAQRNIYSYLGGPVDDCTSWGSTIGWPSVNRQVIAGSTPLDILGVRITYQHDWVTGIAPFFTGSATWTEDTIMRLEPEYFE